MKRFIIIGLSLLVSLTGCSNTGVEKGNTTEVSVKKEKDYDFRNSNWGDSIEDVKKGENLKLSTEIKDNNILVYSGGEIVNLDVTVIYGFDKNNKLTDGFYNVNENHTNNNLYINDYENIKEALSSKYGEPSYDDMEWNNDLYKDKPDNYGFAVSLGDLEYSAGWKIDNTYMTLTLKGDNYDINLSLVYQDGGSNREVDLSGL